MIANERFLPARFNYGRERNARMVQPFLDQKKATVLYGPREWWSHPSCIITDEEFVVELDESGGRQSLQTIQHVFGRVGVTSGHGGHGFGAFTGHPGRGRSETTHGRAALEYGSVEEPVARRRQQMVSRASAARALAENRHPSGIAAELGDVLPDPAQRHYLVLHPVVARHHVVFRADES